MFQLTFLVGPDNATRGKKKKKLREMVKYPAKHGKTWALVQGNMAKCFLINSNAKTETVKKLYISNTCLI